jgi:squalene-associated FAD-dependent desaturase
VTGAARAIVLGGGIAGIYAALLLRQRGLSVTLHEAHGWLGGRAFSFVDRHSGRSLDNGPHVMLGCYRSMRALLHLLGTESEFAMGRALSVSYRTQQGVTAALRLGALPVPMSMPFALLRMPWPMRARWAALRGLLATLWRVDAAWTLAEWIERRGQGGEPAAWLWQPLCRAIMNVEPQEASASLFLATLREAFSGGAKAAAFWIPKRPWGDLIGAPAQRVLSASGVEVVLRSSVRAMSLRDGRIAAVELASGRSFDIGADTLVVSALPWHALAKVLPAPMPFAQLQGAPLVSAHFALDGDGKAPPDEGPLAALVGGEPFHFLYRVPHARRGEFALLAGGCRALDGIPVAQIEAQARAQLARHYPEFSADAPGMVRISKESRATIAAGPNSAGLRPAPGPLPGGPANLHVCGDWTAVGLPSTLEGAARSAERLVQRLDRSGFTNGLRARPSNEA